jgi:hypothetical protein
MLWHLQVPGTAASRRLSLLDPPQGSPPADLDTGYLSHHPGLEAPPLCPHIVRHSSIERQNFLPLPDLGTCPELERPLDFQGP